MFYTFEILHNKQMMEIFPSNIMHISYELYSDNNIGYSYVTCSLPNIFYQLIIHSLSDEDVMYIRLLGIPLLELIYQDEIKRLYTDKKHMKTDINLFSIVPHTHFKRIVV